jgi:hypothetical protein
MLDLRRNRRQDEGLKRFEAALAMTPIGYWGIHTELAPEILYCGLMTIRNDNDDDYLD